MATRKECPRTTSSAESLTFDTVVTRIPDAINLAKIEAESFDIAKTPEGKYALTYLLAARNLLAPVLCDPKRISKDLLIPTGGHEYNPERRIDDVGTALAFQLAQETTNVPNFWIRVEERGRWQATHPNEGAWEQSDRLAFIDPLDETSNIPKGIRAQSTGIAIYNRNCELLTIGVMSLVDESMMFFERRPEDFIFTTKPIPTNTHETTPEDPIRIATLTRRMHALRDLPLFTKDNTWQLDSIGGYAVLAMHNNEIDTIVDPIKGNPWDEYILWGTAAEKMGLIVTDPEGQPIDTKKIVRFALEKNPGDTYRIPFVASRTPEIHKRVLSQLTPEIRNS